MVDPEGPPTRPTLLLSGEARIIQRAVHDLGTRMAEWHKSTSDRQDKQEVALGQLLAEVGKLAGTVEKLAEQVEHLSTRVDALAEREEDTGRHIIEVAQMAGEAKGMARRPVSLNPGKIIVGAVNVLVEHLSKRWLLHLAWWLGGLAGGAFFGWFAHTKHWLK
jgi:hypothetical protein